MADGMRVRPPKPGVPATGGPPPPNDSDTAVRGGRLWRSPDFLKLWAGQSVSELGTAITRLALPTAAITLLAAGSLQIGILNALQVAAYPLLGIVAGVWADRVRRRAILMICDLGRALVLASVPFAFFAHVLGMGQLYAVALVVGVCSVFFDVAYQSYLPSLIGREDLVEGNGKLYASRNVAQAAGPAVAGWLIAVLKAAPAILADSLSFLVSVGSLLAIRKAEPAPRPSNGREPNFRGEVAEGAATVFGHPVLRLLVGSTASSNLGAAVIEAVFLVFAYRDLHLTPETVGMLFAVAALSAVAGAAVAARLARVFGLGPAIAVSALMYRACYLAMPLVMVFQPVLVLVAIMVVSRFFELVYSVNQLSLRQSLVPGRLQGRTNAMVRTVSWGAIPVGSAIGGVLGSQLGLMATIAVGSALTITAVLWILAGPVRLRHQPTAEL